MAAASVCDPCSRRDKTSPAFKHCTDCEDNLCSECFDVHSTFKPCKTHHVVSLSLVADQSFNINKFCTKHAELPLELFCPDHDVLCCRGCMAENHRSCEKLALIDVVSKGVKSSSLFENISKRVGNLTETCHTFTEEVKKIKLDLKQNKVSNLEKVTSLKERLIRRIDEIYVKSVSEINKTYSSLLENTEKNENEVKEKVQNIEEIVKKFEIVSNHGSESQIFVLLNLLKFDLNATECYLEEIVPSVKALAVNFAESDLLSLIKSLGSVTVQEQDSRIQFKPMENQSAQINCPSQFAPTTFQLYKNVSYGYDKDINISGMCVTRDGRLILCNSNGTSKDILVLTCEGQYICNLELEVYPWKITIEPETGDAWITMPHASYVQIVDTKSMSLRRRVKIVTGAYGITFYGIDIAVGTRGKVEIFSKQGIHLKSVQCGAGLIHSLCYKENLLYCTDTNNNKLFGLRADGTRVFTYEYSNFIGPICISSDSAGNVYVLCCNSKNLHKLIADGKLVNIMLDNKSITDTVYAAAFNGNYTNMFIASRNEKNVYFFTCK